MNGKTFMVYGVFTLTGVLLLYTFLGGVILIGSYSVPTAALVATVALVALMVLAAK